jgi:hypothetical protein
MKTELLPCPFCGGEAEEVKDVGYHFIGCLNTRCAGFHATFSYEAWNTRAPLPQQGQCDICGLPKNSNECRSQHGNPTICKKCGKETGGMPFHTCSGEPPTQPSVEEIADQIVKFVISKHKDNWRYSEIAAYIKQRLTEATASPTGTNSAISEL